MEPAARSQIDIIRIGLSQGHWLDYEKAEGYIAKDEISLGVLSSKPVIVFRQLIDDLKKETAFGKEIRVFLHCKVTHVVPTKEDFENTALCIFPSQNDKPMVFYRLIGNSVREKKFTSDGWEDLSDKVNFFFNYIHIWKQVRKLPAPYTFDVVSSSIEEISLQSSEHHLRFCFPPNGRDPSLIIPTLTTKNKLVDFSSVDDLIHGLKEVELCKLLNKDPDIKGICFHPHHFRPFESVNVIHWTDCFNTPFFDVNHSGFRQGFPASLPKLTATIKKDKLSLHPFIQRNRLNNWAEENKMECMENPPLSYYIGNYCYIWPEEERWKMTFSLCRNSYFISREHFDNDFAIMKKGFEEAALNRDRNLPLFEKTLAQAHADGYEILLIKRLDEIKFKNTFYVIFSHDGNHLELYIHNPANQTATLIQKITADESFAETCQNAKAQMKRYNRRLKELSYKFLPGRNLQGSVAEYLDYLEDNLEKMTGNPLDLKIAVNTLFRGLWVLGKPETQALRNFRKIYQELLEQNEGLQESSLAEMKSFAQTLFTHGVNLNFPKAINAERKLQLHRIYEKQIELIKFKAEKKAWKRNELNKCTDVYAVKSAYYKEIVDKVHSSIHSINDYLNNREANLLKSYESQIIKEYAIRKNYLRPDGIPTRKGLLSYLMLSNVVQVR